MQCKGRRQRRNCNMLSSTRDSSSYTNLLELLQVLIQMEIEVDFACSN